MNTRVSNENTTVEVVSLIAAAVEYDSDKEPPPSEPTSAALNWRLDPSISLSDWTIEIGITDTDDINGTREKYHVHKVVLALGPRHSEYFYRLFQNDNFAEAQTRVSRIQLHETAALVFPKLLDYLYSPNDKQLSIGTETATALHYLGQYFEMRHLRWDAKQFWQTDLTVENCATYYEHACLFSDDKVHKAVADVVRRGILSITPASPFFAVSGPDFWLEILHQGFIATRDSSRHVSILLAELCSRHEDMDAELFRQLVDATHLPKIHSDAAFKLIELEERIAGVSETELSSLQERCVGALSNNWKFLKVSDDDTLAFLRKRNPLLLTELFSKTLSRAQMDIIIAESAIPRKKGTTTPRNRER
jgi:hypothetical protein